VHRSRRHVVEFRQRIDEHHGVLCGIGEFYGQTAVTATP
jgi:hypothetical protein